MRFIEVSKKVQEFLESIYFKYPVTSNFSIEWNSIFSFFFLTFRDKREKNREKKASNVVLPIEVRRIVDEIGF